MGDDASRPGQVSGAAGPAGADPAEPASHPFLVGDAARYAVRAHLGQGGMGRVELAFDRRLLREVALKVPRDGGDHAARLAQEAWITAELDHPGIVPVYDAGRAPDGTLYYTMRVIRGRSLEDALAAEPSLAARLRFVRHVLTACEAVAYAHRLGVVHRDLKPHNILVGEFGETQVADWGVARPTGSAAGQAWRDATLPDAHAVETAAGGVVGTPAYMSPEQSLGAPPDPRADVWSLGAVLHRLVAGAPPFHGDSASEVLARVRSAPLPEPPPDAPRELVAITRRALSRDPAARYPSARELAADLASWLDGRRVSAHAYTPLELARRLLRAWRVPLIVAAVALVVLVVGAVVAVDNVVSERDRAVHAEARAQAALATSLVAQARDEAARGQWPEAEVLAARALALDPDHAGAPAARGLLMAVARPRPHRLDQSALPCTPDAVAPDLTRCICTNDGVALYDGARKPRWTAPIEARFVAFADDAVVVVVDRAQRVHRLAAHDGRPIADPLAPQAAHGLAAGGGHALVYAGWTVQTIDRHGILGLPEPACATPRTVRWLHAGADGRLIVGCDDGRLATRDDAQRWTTITTTLGADAVGTIGDVRADGLRLALLNDKGRLSLVDLPSGAVVRVRETGIRGARALAFDATGRRLAVTSAHGGTRVLDAERGFERARLPRGARLVAWDGADLVTWGPAGRERWHIPAALVATRVGDEGPHPQGGVATAEVAPDGRVFLGRGGGDIDLFAPDGTLLAHASLGDQTVKSLSLFPAGDHLVVGVVGGDPVLLHARDLTHAATLGGGAQRRVAALADGTLVMAGWRDAPAIVGSNGRLIAARDPSGAVVSDLEPTPDRTAVVLLEEATGRVLVTTGSDFVPIATVPGAVTLGVDADEVAVATRTALVVLGRADGRERARLSLAVAPLDVAIRPGGGHFVVAHLDGADVLDRSGHVVATLPGHDERVAQLVATDDAVYTASWDGAVRRWAWAPLLRTPGQLAADAARWGL